MMCGNEPRSKAENSPMHKDIEVEIRGRLTDEEYQRLKMFLGRHGAHVESHEREMFLLHDYVGYSKDFVGREIDIRLRNTNGFCEIMLKKKAGDAREEISLPLGDNNLEKAKEIVKAFGCKTAMWMHRLKEVYTYNGIEWALVIAPKNIRFYEAERVVSAEDKIPAAQEALATGAKALGLEVLDDAGMRALIHRLDTEANKVVEL